MAFSHEFSVTLDNLHSAYQHFDVLFVFIGNIHQHSVQCFLPLNAFNQKIYSLLFMWMPVVVVVTVFGVFIWCVSMVTDRKDFISRHLSHDASQEEVTSFIDQYLRVDGLFMLKLISHNTNRLSTDHLVQLLWQTWRETREGLIAHNEEVDWWTKLTGHFIQVKS